MLKKAIWDSARDTIQEWTGQELTECSLYGIRVYTEGSILSTHVDRLPLVSSAIINVAQDCEFDFWLRQKFSANCVPRLILLLLLQWTSRGPWKCTVMMAKQ